MSYKEALSKAFTVALWKLDKENRLTANFGWITNPRNAKREWYEPITPFRVEWD